MSDLVVTGASLIATSTVARASLPALNPWWAEGIRKRAEAVAYKASVDPQDIADDLEQAALIAFWRATKSFDPSRGVPFQHYAQRAIRQAMISQLRRLKLPTVAGRAVSIDDPDLDPSFLEDENDSPEAELERAEIRDHVRRWIAAGPPRQREVYSLVYETGLTQRDAAKQMGVSQPRITQLHKSLLAKGRHDLGGHLAA